MYVILCIPINTPNRKLKRAMSNILNLVGIDAEEFASINENPDLHQRTLGNITRLQQGKRIKTELSLNGSKFPGFVTLNEASLTRLSWTEATKRNGDSYGIVGGTLNPVKMDVELEIDGQTINLIDVLHQFANAAAPNKQTTRDQFIKFMIDNLNMDILNGMSLTFEHLGSDINEFNRIAELMKSVGAYNDVTTNALKYVNSVTGQPSRVRAAWVVPTGKIQVTEFEVAGKDRTATDLYANAGIEQGFINFSDAVFENVRRLLQLDKQLIAMREMVVNKSGAMGDETTRQMNANIKLISQTGRKWSSLWNGAKQRYRQVTPGEYQPLYTWDPANADVGRLTIVVNGEATKADFWTNRSSNTVVPSADSIPNPQSVLEALGKF